MFDDSVVWCLCKYVWGVVGFIFIGILLVEINCVLCISEIIIVVVDGLVVIIYMVLIIVILVLLVWLYCC